MGFYSRPSSGLKKSVVEEKLVPFQQQVVSTAVNEYVRLGLDRPLEEGEKGVVSAIAAAIMAGDNTESYIHIKEVVGIDENKLVAVLAVSGLLAGDTGAPDTHFVLRSVKENIRETI